jgi:hypothetical protein
MKKFVLFVFNGDPMCFIHVLLNALDMSARGHEAKIVVEGAAVKLIPELIKPDHMLNSLWKKCLEAGLLEGVCKACANKLGTLDSVKEQGFPQLDSMSGHPSIAEYRDKGYEVITF